MEFSIINKSKTVSDFRLDAECYKKDYLEIETVLKGKPYSTIGDEVSVFSKGIFDIKAECYSNEGIPFVRIADLKNMMIDESQLVFIPKEENDKSKKSFLSRCDIILSKTAYPAASLVTLAFCNTSQDTIAVKIKTNSIFLSHFLVLFLNSKYGYLQMQRWFTGNIQMHLNLSDSRNIIIPIVSEGFQKSIEVQFEQVIFAIELSKLKYLQAQILLLSELGLLNWKPKHRLNFVKKYSETQKAGRIDAEYHQPKYDEIVEAIKSYACGWDSAKNILNIKDGNISPKEKIGYKYIELANIGNNGEISGIMEAEGQDLPSRARRKVIKDDVIVSSIEGSLSRCALIPDEYDGALCSTGFYIVDSNKINPQTLLVLLKSPIGQEQLKKGCSGTILTAFNKDEIGKIVLPIVDSGIQHQIRQKIIESFKLRKQSRHLLECAKKTVEMAIEKDEETAMKWLESQLDGIEMRN
ncbi:MAG: hypothetical protein WC556_07255 [Candidatus Methanoperedens sp.]